VSAFSFLAEVMDGGGTGGDAGRDEDGMPKTAEKRAEDLAKILAGRLLGLGIEDLLALRDDLTNGKPETEEAT